MPKRDEQILVPFPDENTYLFLIKWWDCINHPHLSEFLSNSADRNR